MERSLKILIAEDDDTVSTLLASVIILLGHEVICRCSSGEQLIEKSLSLRPDLVISDIKMPGMDGLEAAKQLYEELPTPIIIVTAFNDETFIQRAVDAHVLGYLIKPIRGLDLAPAIEIAMKRFTEFQTLQSEAESLRHALEDRKVIERAKGLLMKQAKIDEPEAFQRLQRLARSSGKKLIEVGKMIILSAEAMKPAE
jgi:response regulator NasT